MPESRSLRTTDVYNVLQELSYRLAHLETLAEDSAEITRTSKFRVEAEAAYEAAREKKEDAKALKKARPWHNMGWVLGAISAVFSAGVGYALFMGANATDDEVANTVQQAMYEHNGYVDAKSVDPTTGYPRGHHPDLREAIQANTEAIRQLAEAQKTLTQMQTKLDRRSRYQYEYTKWEVKKSECRRSRNCTRRDMEKPPQLEELEAALIND